jgi:cyclophilin family peptidyl-prolyl cis-trans isomerase
MTIDSTRPVDTFAPIEGEPASTFTGLSNTVGTVSMALPGLAGGGTNQDGGTSSFFVNLASNTFLDQDFTVFAAISDMSVVNQIMALTKVDRTTDPLFGAGSGNLAFSDVPVQANGFQVFIKRAFVIEDTMSIARAMAGIQSAVALSQAGGGTGSSDGFFASSAATAVPEPATSALAIVALLAGCFMPRRR